MLRLFLLIDRAGSFESARTLARALLIRSGSAVAPSTPRGRQQVGSPLVFERLEKSAPAPADDAFCVRWIEWKWRRARPATSCPCSQTGSTIAISDDGFLDGSPPRSTSPHPELELSQLRRMLPQAFDRNHRRRSAANRGTELDGSRWGRRGRRSSGTPAHRGKNAIASHIGKMDRASFSTSRGCAASMRNSARRRSRWPARCIPTAASGRTQIGSQLALICPLRRRQRGEAGQRTSPRFEADRELTVPTTADKIPPPAFRQTCVLIGMIFTASSCARPDAGRARRPFCSRHAAGLFWVRLVGQSKFDLLKGGRLEEYLGIVNEAARTRSPKCRMSRLPPAGPAGCNFGCWPPNTRGSTRFEKSARGLGGRVRLLRAGCVSPAAGGTCRRSSRVSRGAV